MSNKKANDRTRKVYQGLLLGIFIMAASTAQAWWNKDWNSRKQIVVDAGVTGADIKEDLSDAPLLVRLHAGNFGFFAELAEHGNDVRLQVDDKTAAKFHLEKFDPVNEMALVWVKLPKLSAQANSDALWLYYGNHGAAAGSDSGATYDTAQVLVYHFGEGETAPQDATAYGNHAEASTAKNLTAGFIGAAAQFNGDGVIKVKSSPSLHIDPQQGWTFTTWIKIDSAQSDARVFEAADAAHVLGLSIKGTELVANFDKQQTTATALQLGKWQHVALVLHGAKLNLYVDGTAQGSVDVSAAPFNPTVAIGGSSSGQFLSGALDEIGIANTARSVAWIKFLARSQSPDFSVIGFGEDEAHGSNGEINYFAVILQNVTIDGWVIIGLTGVMFVIAVIVIIVKGLLIARVKKSNQIFLDRYNALDTGEHAGAAASAGDKHNRHQAEELLEQSGEFQYSTLYQLYERGVQEQKKRFSVPKDAAGWREVTAEALNLVQVRLDASVVREAQKLNRNMVLLTIAIAGGPFLGLLGTVVGVMITFAAIAATGDVNINAIAPGIAAALAATVAGLAVAIPALFGYNYLLTQIKDITADMRVFCDEFVAALAARLADQRHEV